MATNPGNVKLMARMEDQRNGAVTVGDTEEKRSEAKAKISFLRVVALLPGYVLSPMDRWGENSICVRI